MSQFESSFCVSKSLRCGTLTSLVISVGKRQLADFYKRPTFVCNLIRNSALIDDKLLNSTKRKLCHM